MSLDFLKIDVSISSLSAIMFDKFIDHSKEVRPPEQKLYLADDGKTISYPSENITSFLSSQLPPLGCACKFEKKGGKEFASLVLSHVFITPDIIPFHGTNGKPILFDGFGPDKTLYTVSYAPRTKLSGGGVIKQEAKPRPVLRFGWSLDFEIQIVKNDKLDETKLYNWFCAGGIMIGLGSYRPRYGRFEVTKWDVKDKK